MRNIVRAVVGGFVVSMSVRLGGGNFWFAFAAGFAVAYLLCAVFEKEAA